MSIQDELNQITRRAFVSKMVTQIYNNSPLMSSLIQNANASSTYNIPAEWFEESLDKEPTLGDLVRQVTFKPSREPAYEHPVREVKPSALLSRLMERL